MSDTEKQTETEQKPEVEKKEEKKENKNKEEEKETKETQQEEKTEESKQEEKKEEKKEKKEKKERREKKPQKPEVEKKEEKKENKNKEEEEDPKKKRPVNKTPVKKTLSMRERKKKEEEERKKEEEIEYDRKARVLKKITLYHVPQTRSSRILLLAKELGIEDNPKFEVKTTNFKEIKEPKFFSINPNQQSPSCLVEFESGEKLPIYEAGAIFEFLLKIFEKEAKEKKLIPEDWDEWNLQRHTQLLFWCIATVDAGVLNKLYGVGRVTNIFTSGVDRWFKAVVEKELHKMLKSEKSGWINGADFTITDIVVAYTLHLAKTANLISNELLDYYGKISSRESYKAVFSPPPPPAANKKEEPKKEEHKKEHKKEEKEHKKEEKEHKKEEHKKEEKEHKKEEPKKEEHKKEHKKEGKEHKKEEKEPKKEEKEPKKEEEEHKKEEKEPKKVEEEDKKEEKEDIKE